METLERTDLLGVVDDDNEHSTEEASSVGQDPESALGHHPEQTFDELRGEDIEEYDPSVQASKDSKWDVDAFAPTGGGQNFGGQDLDQQCERAVMDDQERASNVEDLRDGSMNSIISDASSRASSLCHDDSSFQGILERTLENSVSSHLSNTNTSALLNIFFQTCKDGNTAIFKSTLRDYVDMSVAILEREREEDSLGFSSSNGIGMTSGFAQPPAQSQDRDNNSRNNFDNDSNMVVQMHHDGIYQSNEGGMSVFSSQQSGNNFNSNSNSTESASKGSLNQMAPQGQQGTLAEERPQALGSVTEAANERQSSLADGDVYKSLESFPGDFDDEVRSPFNVRARYVHYYPPPPPPPSPSISVQDLSNIYVQH
jgi:hypothetical protein